MANWTAASFSNVLPLMTQRCHYRKSQFGFSYLKVWTANIRQGLPKLFFQKAKGTSGYGRSWPWGFPKSERHHYKCASSVLTASCAKKNSLGISPWKWAKPWSSWFAMLWLHLKSVSLTSGSRQTSGSPTIGTRGDNECMCMEIIVHLELFSHMHWLTDHMMGQ